MLSHFNVVYGYFHVTVAELNSRDGDIGIKQNIFIVCPVTEKVCLSLLYNIILKVLDLYKLEGVCNYAANGVVECILGQTPLYSFNATRYSI